MKRGKPNDSLSANFLSTKTLHSPFGEIRAYNFLPIRIDMMRNICFLCVLFISLIGSKVSAQTGFGRQELFSKGWSFKLEDDSTAIAREFEAKECRRLDLPHDWSRELPLSPDKASCNGYLPGGIAWYQKCFGGDVAQGAPKVFIYFEGVYNHSEVYLNGHLLGKRPSGFSSFCYDMTPYLNRQGQNILAVRVDHSKDADCRWYTGSGIYRDVWLVCSGDTHFAQWGNSWSVKDIGRSDASVMFSLSVDGVSNNLKATVELMQSDGKVVGRTTASIDGQGHAKAILKVRNSQTWTIASPYLYTAKLTLLKDGKPIDHDKMTIGIRSFRWDANKGFALNGKSIKVKGVCLHDDAGVLGVAVPKSVWERRLKELKNIGVNAVRMAHNPHAPFLYDLCDSLGLLVMDEASDEWEFPKRKWIKGWNQGVPGFQGSFEYFTEWIDRDVRDMVRRDRRHASIFMWSVGNEVDYPNDPYSHPILDGSNITQPMYGGYKPDAPRAERIGKIAKRLADVVRAEDDTRAVTGALAGVVMSNETAYPQAVDVVGYNYTESRYDEDHRKYPERVIYGSENRHDLMAWKAVADRDYIFGQFLWTGIDYLGESGRWPARGSSGGLLDYGGFRKPLGWWRASLWSEHPVTYIGTQEMNRERAYGNRPTMYAPDLWNYEDSSRVMVVCYTNAPQARLRLNGQIVGELKKKDERTGMVTWEMPYQPGVLVGEGVDANGRVVSSYRIATSGKPHALKATLLEYKDNVAQIEIDVVDEHGTIVKLADNNVHCRVDKTQPMVLMGLENSDTRDMSDKTDATERVYMGRLMAYVAGKGKVVFSSPMLRGCSLTL